MNAGNMEKKDKRLMKDFFEKKIKEHGFSPKGFDWGGKESQEKRFEVFLEIGNLEGKKILDVGCGAGDFYGYLKDQEITVAYHGCDLVESVIEHCRTKYPEGNFKCGELDIYQNEEFDYIFESGIFNTLVKNNLDFAKDTINKMYHLCKEGIAVNMLSKYRFNKLAKSSKTGFRFDPGEMFNFAREISQKVIMKHDYMPNDFTIFMYRSISF